MNLVYRYSRKEINQYLKKHHYFMSAYTKCHNKIVAYIRNKSGFEWDIKISDCQTLEDLLYTIDERIDGWYTAQELYDEWGCNFDW